MSFKVYEVKIYNNGNKFWYHNGKLHREGGPACEYSDGTKYWYLNGVEHTETEFNAKMNSSPCDGKTVEIDRMKTCLQEN